jgi:hypothetical protein
MNAVCTLYVIATSSTMSIPDLTLIDATNRFWELNNHQAHPDIAMEAIYCNKKLTLILNTTNTGALPDVKPVQQGELPK